MSWALLIFQRFFFSINHSRKLSKFVNSGRKGKNKVFKGYNGTCVLREVCANKCLNLKIENARIARLEDASFKWLSKVKNKANFASIYGGTQTWKMSEDKDNVWFQMTVMKER